MRMRHTPHTAHRTHPHVTPQRHRQAQRRGARTGPALAILLDVQRLIDRRSARSSSFEQQRLDRLAWAVCVAQHGHERARRGAATHVHGHERARRGDSFVSRGCLSRAVLSHLTVARVLSIGLQPNFDSTCTLTRWVSIRNVWVSRSSGRQEGKVARHGCGAQPRGRGIETS